MAVHVNKGRPHDFRLFKESSVRVHPSIPIDADIHKPTLATEKHPLTRAQKQANRALNSQHIVVEHAVRRLKIFRLPGERYRCRGSTSVCV